MELDLDADVHELALRDRGLALEARVLEPGCLDLGGPVAGALALDVGMDDATEVELVVLARDLLAVSSIATSSPRSISIARSQKRSTADMSWVTNTIVLPAALSCSNCSKHFCWNAASPTASTSSTSRMSASVWTATEKPSRTLMPDE